MERIKDLWKVLEAQTSDFPGLFKIRYSDTSKCDAFLGIKYPENSRLLIIRVPLTSGKDFSFKYEFKGLRFEKIYDPDDKSYILLNLVLIDIQLKDIFNSLINDVLESILNESDIKVILRNYTNRLIKWQSLFDKYNKDGLSNDEQRGLYGELYFIREYLKHNSAFTEVVTSWVGPDKALQDFQSGTWAVEVKTTHGNNHQKIHINSERQLDISNLVNLFLYHLSLDVMLNSGETLNQIIGSVRQTLLSDTMAYTLFNTKLFEAGYYDKHASYYQSKGYFIRQDVFYKVEKEFPRIEEKDICFGVGDVKYSIIVSNCQNYIKSDKDVFTNLIAL
jgi:hypothetical protein